MSSKLEKFVNEFSWVNNENSPWAEFNKTLKESKVAVVSTGGLYINCDKPFQIEDRKDVDESFREIPLEIESEQIEIAHEHYEKRYVNKDINTVFPVKRLKELEEEDFIGELSNYNFSITGYIPEPDELFLTGKEIAEKLSELEIDAVLIVPVWPVCQQSGGLLAREIENTGIPTVTLNLIKKVAEINKLPRVGHLPFPFGSPVGEPGNKKQQIEVIKAALKLLETVEKPETIVELPFKWR